MRARDSQLAYLAVHNHFGTSHFGTSHVGFSTIDMASHERGYPALRQITQQIVGAVVFTSGAAAGDLWLSGDNRVPLAEVVIPDNNVLRLRPQPASQPVADPRYDRQARLFGDRGQETLRRLRVAVVGLGGVGNVLVELLARLGVGHLVLIDNDTVNKTNLPRLLAAEHDDIDKPKTTPAARNARRANPAVELTLINDRAESLDARSAIATCDWIFLAADTNSARHWVNATVHDRLIPATQIGVKIPVTTDGTVGQFHNTLAAAEAVNHFMLSNIALHTNNTDTAAVIHHPRTRDRILQLPRQSRTVQHAPATPLQPQRPVVTSGVDSP